MNFEQDVIQRSFDTPVLVDFWAPWCGPCRYLGPVLDQLAMEAGSRWELLKVNTDEYHELMTDYQIQSIPAVKLFHRGTVIAEFTGALPKPEIERWLQKHIPDPIKQDYAALLATMSWPGTDAQITKLAHFIADHAGFADAVIDLAAHQVLTDTEASLNAMKNITFGHPRFDTVTAIRTLAELLEAQPTGNAATDQHIAKSQAALQKKDIDDALSSLIDLVTINKAFQDELPRRAVVSIFQLLGQQHELTRKHQRRFSMALY